jgi:GntR family transcriptional regulator / MocR family aminotransferase
MTPLPPLDRTSAESLQLQVVRHLRAAIGQELLRPGHPLPAIRDLARAWRVSRNTIILALTRLTEEGYLVSQPSRGVFVHHRPPARDALAVDAQTPPAAHGAEAGQEDWQARDLAFIAENRAHLPTNRPEDAARPIDLGYGSNLPLYRSPEWRKTIQRLLMRDRWAAGGTFQPNAGLPSLRSALAEWLTHRHGLPVDHRQVVIISGLQQAHHLISRVLIAPGDRVVVESPCYPGKPLAYQNAQAIVTSVPIDREGLSPGDLPTEALRLICVNPGCNVPTGVTLSPARRQALVVMARASGAYIFEESMYDLLALDGPVAPSLLSMARGEGVIHGGLFAPTLGGGLMLGYLVIPWSLLGRALDTKLMLDNGLPWLEQEALARFIESGELDIFLRRTRTAMLRRRDAMSHSLQRHLGPIEMLGTGQAPRLSWLLPEDALPVADFVTQAQSRGIYIPAHSAAGKTSRTHLLPIPRLISHGYGAVAEGDIDEAIRRIATL